MRGRNLRSTSGLVAALVLVAGCSPAPGGDPGLVIDDARLLDDDQRRRVALFHDLLLADHDIDYRIVTTRTSGDIGAYAVARFEALHTGARSQAGRGLLLVIDPAADRLRLEVGYALEGTYPDAFVAYVEHRQMVPFFRNGHVADGILATTELIVARAQQAAENSGLYTELDLAGSGGGGATAAAQIGVRNDNREYSPAPAISAGQSPEATLSAYFAAMRSRNADSSLALYTPGTRNMLEDWTMTPAQMDNIVQTYRNCRAGAAILDPARRRAVIRYPVTDRQCSPWFFEFGVDGWALDLTMMQRAIRFGRDNSWRLVPAVPHPYQFAFDDWTFDANGFPVR